MINSIAPFVVVSLFWGLTNPLIESSVDETKDFSTKDYSLQGFFNVIRKNKFLIAFGINQIGSVLYGILLGLHGEHYSNLLANSLTSLVTFLAESYLKQKKIKFRNIVGIVTILMGIYLII